MAINVTKFAFELTGDHKVTLLVREILRKTAVTAL
jgi:hypothetical protein